MRAEGIEVDEGSIQKCIEKGLSVVHRDLDGGLPEYPDGSFDYVILNQTLQQVGHLRAVLADVFRVGRRVIIAFPNFAHARVRVQVFFGGRTPVTPSLPHRWYDTPNLHFLSISDFVAYCREQGIRIERSAFLSERRPVRVLPNLRATTGSFLLARG